MALGMVAALLGGLAAAAYMHLRLPLAIVVSPLAPGLLVGVVLGRACKRFKMTDRTIAMLLSLVCCVICVIFYHYAMYFFSVMKFRDGASQIAAKVSNYGPLAQQKIITFVQQHPFKAYDQLVTIPRVHHGGYLGFILTRSHIVWIFALAQVSFGTLIAVRMTRRLAKLPFCAACGQWFQKPVNISVLPLQWADALAAAIRDGDVASAAELNQYEDAPMGRGCAVARHYACRGCQEQFVEVETLLAGRKGAKLPPTRVTPELVRALKDGPIAPPVPAEPV